MSRSALEQEYVGLRGGASIDFAGVTEADDMFAEGAERALRARRKVLAVAVDLSALSSVRVLRRSRAHRPPSYALRRRRCIRRCPLLFIITPVVDNADGFGATRLSGGWTRNMSRRCSATSLNRSDSSR